MAQSLRLWATTSHTKFLRSAAGAEESTGQFNAGSSGRFNNGAPGQFTGIPGQFNGVGPGQFNGGGPGVSNFSSSSLTFNAPYFLNTQIVNLAYVAFAVLVITIITLVDLILALYPNISIKNGSAIVLIEE